MSANVGLTILPEAKRQKIHDSALAYIRDAEQQEHFEAAAQGRLVAVEFLALTEKTYVDEIAREDEGTRRERITPDQPQPAPIPPTARCRVS